MPVVASTGGLADTVIDANPVALASNVATGVQFHPADGMGLAQALRRLCDIYANKRQFSQIQRNGMKQPLDWGQSSIAYANLYNSLRP